MSDQFRKSVFGLLAYLLVSKISTMENLPTVNTSRFSVFDAGELIDVGVDFLGFAAEIDGLPDEIALNAGVRIGSAPSL